MHSSEQTSEKSELQRNNFHPKKCIWSAKWRMICFGLNIFCNIERDATVISAAEAILWYYQSA